MASFREQIESARTANRAVVALEQTARTQIDATFQDWLEGRLDARTVRYRLEAVVRSSYRSAAAIGAVHTAEQSGIPGWTPQGEVFNTEYLQSLLKDVRRNLREFKASKRTEVDRRRAILRIQHSAGVAADRGYTDATESAYGELADFGYRLRKIWLANFVNNVPCKHCRDLHGTEVSLNEEFPSPTGRTYIDLIGPPLHPRCHCVRVILVVSLENAFEELDLDAPDEAQPAPQMMDTDDVKRISFPLFNAILKILATINKFISGG